MAWVAAVLLAATAVIFVVVYEDTGGQLRTQIDRDVSGDVVQFAEALRTMPGSSRASLAREIGGYVRGQPFSESSTLLLATVPGEGVITNHPEVLRSPSAASLLPAGDGVVSRHLDRVGSVRIKARSVTAAGVPVRVAVGEPLTAVRRAQRSIARSFVLAGVLALLLAVAASWLAGATVTLPLRRMARIAARVGGGDLEPRMDPSASGRELRVLADTFNRMLDRLAAAFSAQRDFVADASHELRTPLTVIAGQLEVLAAEPSPAGEDVERVQRVVGAEVERTARLVDDMLLLARSERRDLVVREDVALAGFVADLWASAATGPARRFTLRRVDDVVLHADPGRLAQALRNLIRNAIDHTTAPDGRVELEVVALGDDRVRFTVDDDGPGVPESQREVIFERFRRTDEGRARDSGGAGLGLAIVRAIAEAHGGEVRVRERPGGGARFELEIAGRVQRHRPAVPDAGEGAARAGADRPAGRVARS